jgi:hypothetical protein
MEIRISEIYSDNTNKKVRIVVAFEERDGKSGHGFAKVIEDYSGKSLKVLFDCHIKEDAFVVADGWLG